ncbi:TPM domain-containing protein [Streptomyces solicathayae]|uniref:TPM domain-containing protein n=1 Tax=Streptomyces solicathayae TaxID=3081768 RepID=A0ABZ0LU16_9ACTN|nr:TPM domain-containing protein [Streptomyces sp. HUAS YS2]WOX22273.1 TPM domain-containing protein [Streptomyces sp. HUAS YS2]
MTRTATRTLLALLVAAWWLVVPAVSGARADDPVVLSREGQITDKVGALGDRRAEVERALDRLYDDRRLQLFVVYVRDFSGRSAQNWADATADRNGLGRDDVLLAVATHDRQYAYTVDADSPLTDLQLDDVARTAIEPALRQNDWAGAAIGAANGYDAVLGGAPVPVPTVTPGPADPGGTDSVEGSDYILPVLVVGGAGVVAAFAVSRSRRRKTGGAAPKPGGWGAPQAPAETPLAELDGQARQELVATDDAVRTSQEELGFATAQFGEEAVEPFAEAVRYAQGELTAAFRLRQQLDDAHPEDDARRRSMLEEIHRRCADANTRLDDVAEDFDRLRDLERDAPRALEAADAAFREQSARVGTAEAALAAMRARYAESAASPVASDVEQARDRLLFATENIDRARQAVEAGDNGVAAVHIRAAESAIDQAARLIEAVDRRAQELAEAVGKLPVALAETEADLADAHGLLQGTAEGVSTADLQGRVARAESVIADVRRVVEGGRYDPLDALRRVEEADATLDEALAGARERESGTRRARALLDQALLTARSAIGAATDYVTTHRGAVGSEARTRLAEAQRRLDRAGQQAAADDPQGALAEAQQADALARQAQGLAEQDVRAYGNPDVARGPQGTVGGGLGGAVLGGIILGGLFGGGGGRGGGFGGGFGGGTGGGFGGGTGGGGFGGGPGSFGGGGTRGRRGGGGRF